MIMTFSRNQEYKASRVDNNLYYKLNFLKNSHNLENFIIFVTPRSNTQCNEVDMQPPKHSTRGSSGTTR